MLSLAKVPIMWGRVWSSGSGLVDLKETVIERKAKLFQILHSLHCAAAAWSLCPRSLSHCCSLLFVRGGTTDFKGPNVTKVAREILLVDQLPTSWCVWLAVPQLARAMVSMTCSSLPRSRWRREGSSFCNAVRIWSKIGKGICLLITVLWHV